MIIVGNGGIVELPNGNYIVRSFFWNNGSITSAGAITLCNPITGLNGIVDSSNSLVGSSKEERLGAYSIGILKNGNYIVLNPNWDNDTIKDAGAVTFCNAITGVVGRVNSTNSLVSTNFSDRLGTNLYILKNDNYVVNCPTWDNGTIKDAGAVIWGSSVNGIKGKVDASNALIGKDSFNLVGSKGIATLSNGNYVIISPNWDKDTLIDVGAITWCNGDIGKVGVVDTSNSLIGIHKNDNVGSKGVFSLDNGNYVVSSPNWDNDTLIDVGAITWCNGDNGSVGVVATDNSLIGTHKSDNVGSQGIYDLTNENYVVSSPNWDNDKLTNVGAVTWCLGNKRTSGIVSTMNSAFGSDTSDQIGSNGILALSNGNYVIKSPLWNNGKIINTGAVTFCNGKTGFNGIINSSNSSVGNSADDQVGSNVIALRNGNYIICNPKWDEGKKIDVGAVTWANGMYGKIGNISSSNSLIGSKSYDRIGEGGIVELTSGNYVINSFLWNNDSIAQGGAVTFAKANAEINGIVSKSNSFVGTKLKDKVGSFGIAPLINGNYVILSSDWDNKDIIDAGAATLCDGNIGRKGELTISNSLVGIYNYQYVGGRGVTELNKQNYVVNSLSSAMKTATICSSQSGNIGIVDPNTSVYVTSAAESERQIRIIKNDIFSEFYITLEKFNFKIYIIPYPYVSVESDFNKEDNYLESIIISPNPASDYIIINVGAGSKPALMDEIEIFNIFGEKTTPSNLSGLTPLIAKEGNFKIDVSNLSPGVYFIRIGDRFEKFIKL